VAGEELFKSPEVAAVLTGMVKYLDTEKLESVFASE